MKLQEIKSLLEKGDRKKLREATGYSDSTLGRFLRGEKLPLFTTAKIQKHAEQLINTKLQELQTEPPEDFTNVKFQKRHKLKIPQ